MLLITTCVVGAQSLMSSKETVSSPPIAKQVTGMKVRFLDL